MENYSEFGELLSDLFPLVWNENQCGRVIPPFLCPVYKVLQFLGRQFRRTAHDPEVVAL